MINVTQIIKELADFFGKKLDAIANSSEKEKVIINFEGVAKALIAGPAGESIRGEKGETGPSGRDGGKGEDGEKGKDGVDGVDGKDGKDGKDGNGGKDGKNGKDGKDGSPDTGEQIIEKINSDKSNIIKKEKVEGLSDIEGLARTAHANSKLGLRAAGDTIYIADLSTQTNGVTKTFTITQYRRAIAVMGSDFPSILFPNNGFTVVQGTLTLTTDIAPSSGSQLGFMYVL